MRTAIRLTTVRPRYWYEAQLYRASRTRYDILALRDRHRGFPMLLVGNGPSVNRTPLEELAGMPAIGMNKIDLLYERSTWRPELVVCTNSSVARQHVATMVASSVPVWLPRKARYMVPRELRHAIRWFHLRPDDAFATDLATGVGRSPTVTYAALQLAYWMGADPVVLVGVDHSFVTGDAKPNEYRTLETEDVNHFDPRYFAGQRWGVPDLAASEDAYRRARAAFEADGRSVLDATVGGKLEVFDRIGIEQAVQLAGR